jgi:hypothetical protein
MPPEDFGGSMAKPMQIPGMPQQSSMGRQPFGGQTGGMTPYTPPQQPTMAPQNMGGQPQTGGDFTVNEGMTKPGMQLNTTPGMQFDPFQQALGAMRGTGQQPYAPSGMQGQKPGIQPQPWGPGQQLGWDGGAGWQQMQNIYGQQRQQNMANPAQFGRYQDGAPIADPSINFRANARLPFYGGGWGQ